MQGLKPESDEETSFPLCVHYTEGPGRTKSRSMGKLFLVKKYTFQQLPDSQAS